MKKCFLSLSIMLSAVFLTACVTDNAQVPSQSVQQSAEQQVNTQNSQQPQANNPAEEQPTNFVDDNGIKVEIIERREDGTQVLKRTLPDGAIETSTESFNESKGILTREVSVVTTNKETFKFTEESLIKDNNVVKSSKKFQDGTKELTTFEQVSPEKRVLKVQVKRPDGEKDNFSVEEVRNADGSIKATVYNEDGTVRTNN